jgi:hypothetical protein
MKKRNRISDSGEPYGIPDWTLIHGLSYPIYIRRVCRVYKKLVMINTNH